MLNAGLCFRVTSRFCGLLGALAVLVLLAPGDVEARSKTLMVLDLPWFQSQPYSGVWGWHWTMGSANINPDVVGTNGQREIASWYYPLIGPYDSADPVVLEYHVLLMKLGGIDGAIADWYGNDNFNDYLINNERTTALFNHTRKAGLSFAIMCEPFTTATEISAGFITAANAITHEQGQMLYLQTNYFDDPSYARWRGKPVLLDFGAAYFTNSGDWTNIFSVLNASNQPALFNEDQRLAPVGVGAFDWPPMGQSANGILSNATMESYLGSFEVNAAIWSAYVSGAWPRFHDYYAQAGVHPSYGYLDDQNGTTFRETLTNAMTDQSPIIQLVTWNDFGEGTIIEPTVQYGFRDLGIIQDFRRQYLEPDFPYHTNDLTAALRLYNLRRQYSANAIISAELDRIFTNAVSGQLSTATVQLTGLESNRPVIYNSSFNNNQLQFTIGGFLSTSGVAVESTTNISGANWQTLTNLPASTTLTIVNLPVIPNVTPVFFRLQISGP